MHWRRSILFIMIFCYLMLFCVLYIDLDVRTVQICFRDKPDYQYLSTTVCFQSCWECTLTICLLSSCFWWVSSCTAVINKANVFNNGLVVILWRWDLFLSPSFYVQRWWFNLRRQDWWEQKQRAEMCFKYTLCARFCIIKKVFC